MSQSNKKSFSKNPLEWSVFLVSLLLVLAIFIYLGYETITHQASPPDIQITYELSPTENHPFRYHVVANNIGGETAEEVKIELVLDGESEAIEKAEIQLAFLPKGSKREAWVNFLHDPQKAKRIIARVISFNKP